MSGLASHAAPRIGAPRYIQNCSCNTGYFGSPTPFSDPACQQCPADTYNDKVGLPAFSNCTACPSNTTSANATAGQGRGACKCLRGHFGSLGHTDSSMCESCPPDTYGPHFAAATKNWCRPCPRDTSVPGGAGVSAVDCKCNAGLTGPSGGPCAYCSAGTYKALVGSAPCTACPNGTYSSTVGASHVGSCIACPSNSSSPLGSVSAKSCTCNIGFTGPKGGPCTLSS